jgi:AcrR family transcriptional regulator
MTDSGTPDPQRSIWQPPVPTESPRANSRAALVEAAFEEFSTKGYEAATVAGIAERAGVTTGALYAHFRGKLELLVEVVGISPVADVVQTISSLATRPWAEVSKLLSEGMATPPDRRTLLSLDVIVAARRDPEIARVLRLGLETYLDVIKQSADAGAALGLLDPALDHDDLARVLAIMNLGLIVFGALGEAAPSAEAYGRIADLLLQSAGGAGATGAPGALSRVRSRAAGLEQSKRFLHEGIVEAVAAGHTLRQVGEAAGLSHERVRQVLREDAERGDSARS